MQNRRSWQRGSQSELEDLCRGKVAIRSFIEAGLSTYGRADSVAKEPGRIRRLVFANGLRFSCKNLTSKCTSLRFTCNRHSESGIAVKS
jgi:hypothetical protein